MSLQLEMSILLVEENINSRSELKKALLNYDYKISSHINISDNLLEKSKQGTHDILIIKTNSPSKKTLQTLTEINQLAPLPMIIFAQQDEPLLIQASIEAGVSAYVVNDTQPQRLKSIITVACERFKQSQSLRNELEQTKSQLESRKLIERAKGFIMQQKNISEQQAFNMLRKMAMNNGHSMAIVSKNVIDVHELLSAKYN